MHHQPRIDLGGEKGKFPHAHDIGQRAVLDEGDPLVHKGGQHGRQRLWQHHPAQHLPAAHAQGRACIPLALRHGAYASGYAMRQIGAANQGQGADHGDGAGHIHAHHHGQQKVNPEDQHQHGNGTQKAQHAVQQLAGPALAHHQRNAKHQAQQGG